MVVVLAEASMPGLTVLVLCGFLHSDMVLPENYTFWVQCFHTLECGTRGSQVAVQREVPNYFPCRAVPERILVAPCPQANALYRK